MDLVLEVLDDFALDDFYGSYFPDEFQQRDSFWRQYTTVFVLWLIGGWFLYFSTASISYWLLFDKDLRKHKHFLPNQELKEIAVSVISIPLMAIPSAAIFVAEVRGYSLLYDNIGSGVLDWLYVAFSILLYLLFTDALIYWIHRILHWPIFYAPIHKLHHKWIITTPFARQDIKDVSNDSHAFHPLDGFSQSIPYHLFVFIFPLNKFVYLALFILVNVWTVSIHDNNGMVSETFAGTVILGADHHTVHHRQFNYNYGQYTTLWDRWCGTERLTPEMELKIYGKQKEKST